jgi:hypothetical protein
MVHRYGYHNHRKFGEIPPEGWVEKHKTELGLDNNAASSGGSGDISSGGSGGSNSIGRDTLHSQNEVLDGRSMHAELKHGDIVEVAATGRVPEKLKGQWYRGKITRAYSRAGKHTGLRLGKWGGKGKRGGRREASDNANTQRTYTTDIHNANANSVQNSDGGGGDVVYLFDVTFEDGTDTSGVDRERVRRANTTGIIRMVRFNPVRR